MSIVDNTYGKWTVIEESERQVGAGGRKRRQFLCRCECGNEAQVLRENLVTGKSKGCADCNKGGRPKSRSTALGLLLLALIPSTVHGRSVEVSHDQILNALIQVESNGNDEAIGCLQIWKAYWHDATEFSDVGGTYKDCFRREYAKKIVNAYMMRYCKKAWLTGDWEIVARIHNGGPRGGSKKSTEKYWLKVRKVLGQGVEL